MFHLKTFTDMKNSFFLLPLLISLFLIQPSVAQQSIGFSDSTDFQHIIDYRLPDWGYSNFYLSTGRFRTTNEYLSTNEERVFTSPAATASIDTERENHITTISLSPTYQYYRQSEQQIHSLNTSLNIGSGIRNQSNQVDGSSTNDNYIIQEQDDNLKTREASIRYSIYFNSKYYAWNDLFITGSMDGDMNFAKSKSERNDELNPDRDQDQNEFSRHILFYPQLGIGFGRVRNVAPQIRAIRMKERYQEISDQSFTNNEIVESAEQFTRIQQYKSTRDRHQKYFWGDMNELLSGKLDDVSAYDLFYLNDVLNENLGQRHEGFDVSFRGSYRYQNSLNKTDEQNSNGTSKQRNISIHRIAGVISNLRWYKNLSLNHQLSFEAEYELLFPLEKDHNTEYDTDIFADFSWLWTITDRYLLTTSLRNFYSKPVFKERITENKRFANETYLTGSFSYFIENRLSLTGSLSANLDLNEQENTSNKYNLRRIRWSAMISLRYYFARNLF